MPTKTLTVKDIIPAELLKVCHEATRSLRDDDDKKKKKPKYEAMEIAKMRELLKGVGWEESNVTKQMEIYSILHNAPELKTKTIISVKVFAVVVMESNAGGHSYDKGKPHIVVGKTDTSFSCFHHNGTIGSCSVHVQDKPRLATENEIESCIANLTSTQMKSIMTADVFKPIMDAAMSREVMVTITSDDNVENNNEIQLSDGRTITMAEV